MHIILLGPPGSGKGTQASLLASDLKIAHISTGEILREEIRRNSPLGISAGEYVRSGKLVPDEIVIAIVKERTKKEDCREGFILDGFPRTIPQAMALEKEGVTIDIAVSLEVTEEECVRRLGNRRSCLKCGAVYNPLTQPPKKEGVCDGCGGPLIIREDDKAETIRERFRVYSRQTEPLLGFYKESKRVSSLDGVLNPEKILTNLKNLVSSILSTRVSNP